MHAGDDAAAGRLEGVETFALAAALGSGLAEARGDEAAALEAIERGVERAGGDGAAGARLDVEADGDAIGVGAEAHEREEDQLLEVTDGIAHAASG